MENYYREQAGSGLGGYAGIRYQKGHGWFGRMIKGGLVPILRRVLPYLGKRALETGVGVAQDMMEGEQFKAAAKKRFKSVGQRLEEDAITKVKQLTGGGLRRRKKKKPKLRRMIGSGIQRKKLTFNKRRTKRPKQKRKVKKVKRKRKISFL